MCRKLVLLTSFVLVMMMAGAASADLVVSADDTETLDSDLTDSGLVDVEGHLIVNSGNILFQSRSRINGPNNVGTGGTRPEITVNGGNFHVDARFDMGQGDDAYLTMNGGLFRIGNLTSASDTGDLKFPDDPGGTHRIWLNGGTLRVHRLQLISDRDPQIIVGGGVLQIEDLGQGDPTDWLTEINPDIEEPVLVPAEGFIEVVITYDVPVAGGAEVSAIAAGPYAENPDPGRGATGVCPDGLVLSWTPTDEITDPNHDVYFDPNLDDVIQATRDNHVNIDQYSENQDSNEYSLPALQLNTTYYWRVDEVDNTNPGDPCIAANPVIWSFTTEDGNAFNRMPTNNLRGWNPDSPLTWTPSCIATSQNLYLSTDFNDVNDKVGPIALGAAVDSYAGALASYTRYYWRVETVGGGDTEVWTFRTGSGGLLVELSLEGTLGTNLPATVPDTSGNGFDFTTFSAEHDSGANGSAKYGDGRFGGTSADFEPNAGLYRLDTGDGDPLRLDGYQYTVELWIKPETLTDAYGDITLIGKAGGPWRIQIYDPGGSNELRQTHNGNNETEGVIQVGEWQHIAAVWDQLDPDLEQMRLYYNGDLINTNDEGPNPSGNSDPVAIGMERQPDGTTGGYFDGLIDEVKIWDIIVLPTFECSVDPSPPHMADRLDPCDSNNTVLSWTPGPFADHHNVYFGTDANVVYQGQVDGNMYPESGNLELEVGRTYYWRVDDVNDGEAKTYEGFLWRFSTLAVIPDPNMIVWYKFDETGGDLVADSSGHYNSGDIDDRQDDTWDPNDGRFPGCIHFHENERIDIVDEVFDYLGESISISVWWKEVYREGDDNWFCGFGDDDVHMAVRAPDDEPGNPGVVWYAGNEVNDVLEWNTNALTWRDDWHHLVFTKNAAEGTMKIYFDTVQVAFTDDANGTTLSQALAAGSSGDGFRIGAQWGHNDDLPGKVDDFRVYDYEISQDKINELYRGGDVEYAWAPQPIDGAIDVLRDTDLTWKPGDYTQSTGGHKVYFGTDWDDVNDMTDPCATLDLGSELYDPPGLLGLGQTYYWRVDEVNGPNTWKGNVWQFTVADFVVLDDFESYDKGDNLIWYTWYCKQAMPYGRRSGAYLELSTSIFHGDQQAMKYTYETDGTEIWDQDYDYADACLPLDEIDGFQDWTSVDVRLLTIFFYGQAENDTNDTEQMYMGVEDSALRYAEMRYGDHPDEGEALNDLKVEEWQRWDVPFIWFTDSNAAVSADIDFSAISSVYLGFGDKADPQPAGNGLAYFDDLRLTMAFCNPQYGPTGDLSGDCFVGVADIGAIGDQWLRSDVNVNPVTEPPTSDPNLVGHWKLDGDATDSSGSNYHGTAEGAYEWTTGKDGQAIDLSGGWVVVDDNGVTPKLRTKEKVSVMAWIYLDEPASGSTRVVIKGENDKETFGLECSGENGGAFIFRDANGEGPYAVNCGYELQPYEWVHIAGTYDQNEQLMYCNGAVENSETRGALLLFTDPNDGLGIGGRYPASDTSGRFEGKIDDVRVYDRAVTAAEIGYIACGSDGVCPLESEANLVTGENPEVINFRDYAKLFDYWGVEQLWPEPAP